MDSKKYIVHKESISLAVMNGAGKIVMECVIETKASLILQFIDGLRVDSHLTFEEGTSAAWLYDLLKPHVRKLVVCDPRKNAAMREGNQNDKIDARRLAELLRLNHLHPVYQGEHGLRSLKELVRSYFGFCETPRVLVSLTCWVRARLRMALWRRWKTTRRRRAALLALGVRPKLASNTASSSRGPWYLAHAKALSVALPTAYFKSLGLPTLADER
jgi:hypothetical protein